ncbi:MAG: 30S ribosomal protein S12 methylthiotransferase RimO, partial [Gemmatimonadota bacterium]|nr:30S ribosomal protein S12 methylthiotransferase RimO [Gemmatimonadota bacterium]
RMRRPERRQQIRERVGWLRDRIPGLTLRTTVIVGFPGETEEDFGEMLDLLGELRFDRVGAFAYSPEEGTPAATMDGQVPDHVKADRLEQLMDHQRYLSFDLNEAQIGSRQQVLVDYITEEGCVGRTRGQAPEVDGHTRLGHAKGVVPGNMVTVEIVDAEEYDLIGRVVDA